LALFLRSIKTFLKNISKRVTEIGIGIASIKLPEVRQAEALQIGVIRELETDAWIESSSTWFQAFASSAAISEYVLLNIGDGDQWITSRLFIFAVMLQRMKSLKVIVFTRLVDAGGRKFLGCASPEGVRWALAVAQPWLETAFAKAYAGTFDWLDPTPPSSPVPTVAISGAIAPGNAQNIVSSFIFNLRLYGGTPPDTSNWITILGKPGQEHATWLNESTLPGLLGIHLSRDAVEMRTDDSDAQRKKELRRVVGKSAPYVAMLKSGFYESLVNRIALLAEIGESAI
jgi:hypothetical protein